MDFSALGMLARVSHAQHGKCIFLVENHMGTVIVTVMPAFSGSKLARWSQEALGQEIRPHTEFHGDRGRDDEPGWIKARSSSIAHLTCG